MNARVVRGAAPQGLGSMASVRPGTKWPLGAFGDARPRYVAIAQQLWLAITSGEYPVGALLPTEMQLCRRFGASRHTIRESLRMLRELGLVVRHHGVGTRVLRDEIAEKFVADIASIEPGRSLTTVVSKIVFRAIERRENALIALPEIPGDGTWQRLDVLRTNSSSAKPVPVSLSHVYIAAPYRAVVRELDPAKSGVFALIESKYGRKIVSIKQEIRVAPIVRADAKQLKTAEGSLGLSILTVYRGEGGAILGVSQAVSPADRFSHGIEFTLDLGH